MPENPLRGIGVLVTRPVEQAEELVAEVERVGGRAIRLPLLEIQARSSELIRSDLAELPVPDIAILVSPNAVRHGLSYANGAVVAAIGPATEAAICENGVGVDVTPDGGFDSESLLATDPLTDVDGKNVLIIRGDDGRELLARTLRQRGAIVNYLSVYERKCPAVDAETLRQTGRLIRSGDLRAIVIMSIQTLQNLTKLFSESDLGDLANVTLVTPAARVLKEALHRYPESRPALAESTAAADIVAAIVNDLSSDHREQ